MGEEVFDEYQYKEKKEMGKELRRPCPNAMINSIVTL